MKLTIEINSIAELYELSDLLKKLPLILTEGLTLESLELDIRTYNCLKAENIYTVEKLLSCTKNDILRHPNTGRKSLLAITTALAKHGLKLKD